MENIIHYGFGVDYLPNWGIKEALREIYQNFLDYGDYTETPLHHEDGTTLVSIFNIWNPETLEFLRIGNSQKGGQIAIGKHGEGLKMAFLIFLREGLYSSITTPYFYVTPVTYGDKEIGDCFGLKYQEIASQGFKIQFVCKTEDFLEFKENLITKEDILFTDRVWGSVVNKPAGRVYSGGLFVAEFENMSHAYDIRPDRLPLDRDRSVPRHFDVAYATSNILGSYGKFKAKDVVKMDSTYLPTIPESAIQEFKPVLVGKEVNFVYQDEEVIQDEEMVYNEELQEEEVVVVERKVLVDKIVSNDHVKASLKRHSFFESAIKKLKLAVTSQMGLNDLLVQYYKKHVYTEEAKQDFNLILERAGIELEQESFIF